MDDPTESAVVLRAQRGDAAAREALARRYLRAAYAVALAVTRNPSDAEDIAQEALLAALQRLEQCKEPARFAAWLLAGVRHRALDHREKHTTRATLLAAHPTPEAREADPFVDTRRRRALLAALEALTPTQREVVLLHDLESWTHAEIAAALGMSEEMSRQHLFITRRLMREKLGLGAREETSS